VKGKTCFIVICILLSSIFTISEEMKTIDKSFAQNDIDNGDNENDNSVIGQDGDRNEVSQIKDNLQQNN